MGIPPLRAIPLAAGLVPAALAGQLPAPTAAVLPGVPTSGVPTSGPRTHAARPTVPAITAADLTSRLYVFADDSMMGREAGTLGNVKGTTYIAAQVKRLRLAPAGENGTYFQTLPFKTRAVDRASTITAAGRTLVVGTDFAAAGGRALTRVDVPVVYGGVFGDSTGLVTPTQAAGKLVVLRLTPASPQVSRGPLATLGTAAAIAIVTPDWDFAGSTRPVTFYDQGQATARAYGGVPIFVVTGAAAQSMFPAPLDGLAVGAPGTPAAVDVRVTVAPALYPARNVIAVLPGSDPTLRGEYVAVGAHNDHIGVARTAVDHDSLRISNHLTRPEGAEDAAKMATPEQQAEVNRLLADYRKAHPGSARPDSVFNGADDDGSGSVSVLEIAERLAAMKTRPKRSVLFVWHAGEEKGLLGSGYFTDHPTVPRDSVVAQLNIDMIGRGARSDVTGVSKDGQTLHGGPDYLQLVGSRRLSTELGDLAEAVNARGRHGLRFDYSMDADGHPQSIYCRSDHYEYARYGIPIVFFTTGGHSDYHQVTDEPEYIDYDHMARVANYVADLAVAVADLDHRVVVDKPKPDPKGDCQQ